MNSKNMFQRFSALVVLGSILCMVPMAMAAGRSDSQIQGDVTKYLQGKSRYQGVTASTEDGIVTLEGNVNLYVDRTNLEKKVKKTKNVDAVRNHVQVQSNVSDSRLEETLSKKLRYDRVGQGNTFNAIDLGVKDGVVTLGGNVHDYPSRNSAIAIAETTPGVKDVINNIAVAPTSGFDDDLRLKLFRAIYKDPSLQKYALDPQRPIRIVVDNGHVTLAGVVNTAMDKQVAGMRAGAVPGVFSIDNQLLTVNN